MKKIAITGSEGVIGQILQKGLSLEYDIEQIDRLLGRDVCNYQTLVALISRSLAVIHLAWDTQTENWQSPKANPVNRLIWENVYRGVKETGVPKLIMASSVWADDWQHWKGPGLMDPYQEPSPQNAYGKSKVMMEKLGRDYAALGLMVICLRFGSVTENDQPFRSEPHIFLSHRDCVSLVREAIKVPRVPENFAIVYGVSDNPGRIHNLSNLLGWRPS